MTTYHVIQGGQSGTGAGGNPSTPYAKPKSVNFATILSETSALVADDLAKLEKNTPVGDNCLPNPNFMEFNQGMLIGTAMKAVVRRYEEAGVRIEHKGYVLMYADMNLQHARDLVSEGFGGFGMAASVETTLTELDRKNQAEGIERTLGGGGFQVSGGCSFANDLTSDVGMMVYAAATNTAEAIGKLREVQEDHITKYVDMLSGRNPGHTKIRIKAEKEPQRVTLEEVFKLCPVQYIVPRGSNDVYEVDVRGTMRNIISAFSNLIVLQDEAERELKRLASDPKYREHLAKLRSEELLGVKSGTSAALPSDTDDPLFTDPNTDPDEF